MAGGRNATARRHLQFMAISLAFLDPRCSQFPMVSQTALVDLGRDFTVEGTQGRQENANVGRADGDPFDPTRVRATTTARAIGASR